MPSRTGVKQLLGSYRSVPFRPSLSSISSELSELTPGEAIGELLSGELELGEQGLGELRKALERSLEKGGYDAVSPAVCGPRLWSSQKLLR